MNCPKSIHPLKHRKRATVTFIDLLHREGEREEGDRKRGCRDITLTYECSLPGHRTARVSTDHKYTIPT